MQHSVMKVPTPPVTNFRAHGFEGFCLGASSVTYSVIYFLWPHELAGSIIGTPRSVALLWNLMYFVGGLIVIIGLFLDDRCVFRVVIGRKIEAMGLALLLGALAINFITSLRLGFAPGQVIIFWLFIASADRLASTLARSRIMAPVAGSYRFRGQTGDPPHISS